MMGSLLFSNVFSKTLEELESVFGIESVVHFMAFPFINHNAAFFQGTEVLGNAWLALFYYFYKVPHRFSP